MSSGERARLRAVTGDDLQRFVEWFNDPEITRGLSRISPLNIEEERRWFEGSNEKDIFERPLAIDALHNGVWVHIGSCGFFNHDPVAHQAELGIVIGDKRYWDQGLGTEAMRLLLEYGFQTLNFRRITLRVLEFNQRARKVYERAGFVLEGRLRQDAFRQGKYWDTLVMSILRSEWQVDSPKEG
jgi:RimJ/RimL family protein N-acetyltransferase